MKIKSILAIGLALAVFSSNAFSAKCADESDVYNFMVEIAEQNCICPELVESLIFYESSWNAKATNKDCIGLMQIKESSHKDRIERLAKEYGYAVDLYNPYLNILVGVDYLAELAEDYEICLALDIYNGNSKAFKNYEQGILSTYANKVLTLSAELEKQHNK